MASVGTRCGPGLGDRKFSNIPKTSGSFPGLVGHRLSPLVSLSSPGPPLHIALRVDAASVFSPGLLSRRDLGGYGGMVHVFYFILFYLPFTVDFCHVRCSCLASL